MTIIGLTGGIGSGKSTIAKMLAELGAIIINADQVARVVVEPGTPLLNEIVREFGEKILTPSGELNRQLLALEVFNDEKRRGTLNNLTHPAIITYIENELNRIKAKDREAIVVIEAPLLVEAGMVTLVDEIWITEASQQVQVERILMRDGISRESAIKRIKSQISSENRRAYGDVIFNTEQNLDELKVEVIKEWERLSKVRDENRELENRP